MFTNDDFQKLMLAGLQPAPQASSFDLGAALGVSPSAGPPPAAPPPNPALSPIDRGLLGLGPAPAPAPAAPPPPGLSPIDRGILGLGAAPPGPDLGVGGLTPPAPIQLPQPSAAPAPPMPKQKPAAAPTFRSLQADQQQAAQAEGDAALQAGAIEAQAKRAEGEGEQAAESKFQRDYQKVADAYATKVQEYQDRTQALAQQYQDLANTKIDPDRYVKNMPTWQKVSNAIAIAIGGIPTRFGAEHGQNENVALNIINHQISQDIQAQMQDLETRKAGLQGKGTQLQQEIALGKNAQDAQLMATIALRESAGRQALAQAKVIGSPEAIAKAQQLQAAIRAQNDQALQAAIAQHTEAGAAAQNAETNARRMGVENARTMALLPTDLANAKTKAEVEAAMGPAQITQANLQNEVEKRQLALVQSGQMPVDPKRALTNIGKPELDASGTPTGRMLPSAAQAPLGGDDAVKEVNQKIAELTPVLQGWRDQIADAKKLSMGGKALAATFGEGTSDVIQRMKSRQVLLDSAAHMMTGRVSDTNLDLMKDAAGSPTIFSNKIEKMKQFYETMRSVGQAELGRVGYNDHWEPPSSAKPIRTATDINAPPLPPDQAESRGSIAQGRYPGASPNYMQNLQQLKMRAAMGDRQAIDMLLAAGIR